MKGFQRDRAEIFQFEATVVSLTHINMHPH